MNVWSESNLIDKIEEILICRYIGFEQDGAITRAVAYIVFNQHHRTLVHHGDTFKMLDAAISPDMILGAVGYAQSSLASTAGKLREQISARVESQIEEEKAECFERLCAVSYPHKAH